jgi:uncharacterized membrane protein
MCTIDPISYNSEAGLVGYPPSHHHLNQYQDLACKQKSEKLSEKIEKISKLVFTFFFLFTILSLYQNNNN